MTATEPTDPATLDPAQAARAIEDAGIADETAAYVDAAARTEADAAAKASDADAATDAEPDAEAHPS